jgi:hypothetical protein
LLPQLRQLVPLYRPVIQTIRGNNKMSTNTNEKRVPTVGGGAR